MNFLLIVAGNVDNLSMHLNISAESSVNCLLKCKKKKSEREEEEEENERNDMETSSPMPTLSLIFVCATQRK